MVHGLAGGIPPDDAAGGVVELKRAVAGVIKGLRLGLVLQAVVAQVITELAQRIAESYKTLVALQPVIKTVGVETLAEIGAVKTERPPLGDGGFNIDHPAHRVAAVQRRERPIDHLHLGDFVGRYQSPARRAVPATLQKIMQRHAVGEHHGPRVLHHVRRAHAEHAVGIAYKPPTHNHPGLEFHRILGGGHIDGTQVALAEQARRTAEWRRAVLDAIAPNFYLLQGCGRRRQMRDSRFLRLQWPAYGCSHDGCQQFPPDQFPTLSLQTETGSLS